MCSAGWGLHPVGVDLSGAGRWDCVCLCVNYLDSTHWVHTGRLVVHNGVACTSQQAAMPGSNFTD